MAAPRSFGESFRLHHAVQMIVTTAARDGSPICGPSAMSALAGSFSSFTVSELEAILRRAASEHDVAITTPTGTGAPGENHAEIANVASGAAGP